MSRKPQAIPQPPPGFWVAAVCAIAVQLGLVTADPPARERYRPGRSVIGGDDA